jgi:hypothetical protein
MLNQTELRQSLSEDECEDNQIIQHHSQSKTLAL